MRFGVNLKDDPFSIKVDLQDFDKKLQKFRQDIPKIGKKLMAYVFQKIRNDIKKNIKSNFTRRKGWLYSDLNYWAFDDLAGAIFTRNSKRMGVHYASVLENGATISAKDDKYLTFYTGKDSKGKPILKKVKSVTIPPRPFFKPVVDSYWGGGGFKAAKLMDEGLEKEIKKYVEKKGGGLVVVDREAE
jgi:hypothetical protein